MSKGRSSLPLQLCEGRDFACHSESIDYLSGQGFQTIPRKVLSSAGEINAAGMISPAFWSITVSPMRMSFSSIKSWLWRVALVTVVPNLTHFASRDAMDIDGMGPAVMSQLIGQGLVKTPADLYFLTQEQLAGLERMGKKSAQNAMEALDKSRGRGLPLN